MNEQNIRNGHLGTDSKTTFLVLKDSFLSYIFEKLKRISQASFLVSDIMKDESVLKKEIRNLSFKVSLPSEIKDILQDKEGATLLRLADLETLFELALKSGEISGMNAGILISEISKIISAIELKKEDVFMRGKVVLEPDFFSVSAPKVGRGAYSSKGQNPQGQSSVFYNNLPKQSATKVPQYSEEKIQKILNSVKDKSARRQQVLDTLKGRGEISIKDISEVIKDCSEKTIQRELNSLLAEGLVKRTGDRRWSKYSLS